MAHIMNDEISVFKGIDPNPTTSTTWQQVLKRIESDRYQEIVNKARSIADTIEYREFKKKMPAVTFCGKFKASRKKANIEQATGFIIPDLDHLEDVEAVFELLAKDENIWFAFRSPSGEGIKCGIRAENIQTDDDIKVFYAAVERYLRETYSITIDPACKDISRLTFVSYDPNLWINPNPYFFDISEWTREVKITRPAYNPEHLKNSGGKQKYARKVLESCCEEIRQSAPGHQHHTRLRMARLIGGYIHYIDESEALAALEQAVTESGAKYINQAMKTVKDGLEYGKRQPIAIEDIGGNDVYPEHTSSGESQSKNKTKSPQKHRIDISNVYTAPRMLEAYRQYLKDLNNNQLRIGIGPIDQIIRGVGGGEVLTLIARAGAFKTATLQNILLKYIKNSDLAAVFFSIEMPVPSVTERYLQILGRQTGYDIENAYRQNTPHQVKIMEEVFSEEMSRLFVVPTKISLSDIGGYIRLIESEYNVKVGGIGIDYLGLIDAPGQNEYETVSRVARGAKDTAKLLNLPVVILSQVSRKGGDGEVEISMDMGRGSGAIEEGADFILGLWQEQKDAHDFIPPPTEPIEEYDLICRVLKNRKGPKGSRWKLELDPTCFALGDDATPHEPKPIKKKGF